jgi:hypothetical protein
MHDEFGKDILFSTDGGVLLRTQLLVYVHSPGGLDPPEFCVCFHACLPETCYSLMAKHQTATRELWASTKGPSRGLAPTVH